MDDGQIIELFWNRSERAIYELGKKYDGMCHSLSYHILNSHEDAEECVSDAYRILWESIPPEHPDKLEGVYTATGELLLPERAENKK